MNGNEKLVGPHSSIAQRGLQTPKTLKVITLS